MTVLIIIEGTTLDECVARLPAPPWLEALKNRKEDWDTRSSEQIPENEKCFRAGFEHFRERILAIISKDAKTSPGLQVTLTQLEQKVRDIRMSSESKWPEIK